MMTRWILLCLACAALTAACNKGSGADDMGGDGDLGADGGTGAGDLRPPLTSPWMRQIAGGARDLVAGMAVDSAGNVVVVGEFGGSLDLGGGALTSAGGQDAFVAMYTSAGDPRWSLRLGGPQSDGATAVAVDGAGDILVTGVMSDRVDFGAAGVKTSAGGTDVFLLKLGPDGTIRWAISDGGSQDDAPRGLVASAGGPVVAGHFRGAGARFAGDTLNSAGDQDLFLARYDGAGRGLGAKRFGSTGFEEVNGLARDAAGHLLLTGSFDGTIGFGAGDLTTVSGSTDLYVAALEANGDHRWARSFGGPATDRGQDIAADAAGNVVVTGSFRGNFMLGGSALSSKGGDDVLLVRLGPDGAPQWAVQGGGSGADVGLRLALGPAGQAFVLGTFSGSTVVGGDTLMSTGDVDVFLAQYDGAGGGRGAARFGGAEQDMASAVAASASGAPSCAVGVRRSAGSDAFDILLLQRAP